MFPATLCGGNGSVHSGGFCAISVPAASRMSMLDKGVSASTLRLPFISDLSAPPGCCLLDFTLSPNLRSRACPQKETARTTVGLPAVQSPARSRALLCLKCFVNVCLPDDALVCLITTFFTNVLFSVVPGANQKLAAASNVPSTIIFQHEFLLFADRRAVNRMDPPPLLSLAEYSKAQERRMSRMARCRHIPSNCLERQMLD